MTAVRDGFVTTARGRFAVRRCGDEGAPLVVCLHGFPDDASTFDALATSLCSAGVRVVAPYLRGYRPSPVDGDMTIPALADDLLAVVDALSPDEPVFVVGHDYGAQITDAALARHGSRVRAAVTLAGPHPSVVLRNARRHPRQWWQSRYIALFQLRGVAERIVARHDLAYIDALWRRWSPGFTPPPEHLRTVKRTIAASMPAPIAMYRAGGFGIGTDPIGVATLFVAGQRDGCLLPELAEGQERLFTGRYEQQTWPDVGHFPHLERPERTAETVRAWVGVP